MCGADRAPGALRRSLALVVLSAGIAGMAVPVTGEVVVTSERDPGSLRLHNNGPSISLASRIIVERWRDGRWIETPVRMNLVEKCSLDDPPACLTLPAGTTMTPVPWRGNNCSGQCPYSCRSNQYVGPGQFRFVVKSCDGTRAFSGPEFVLPAGNY
jgi:hypothetical protein